MWKKVEKFDRLLLVSDRGEIRELVVNASHPEGFWRDVCPFYRSRDRDLGVNVRENGRRKKISAGRLVFETYVRKLEKGEEMQYKNGDKTKIELLNLSTQKRSASKCRPVKQVDEHGRITAFFPCVRDAAEACGIPYLAVAKRAEGKIKRPFEKYGYSFEYMK